MSNLDGHPNDAGLHLEPKTVIHGWRRHRRDSQSQPGSEFHRTTYRSTANIALTFPDPSGSSHRATGLRCGRRPGREPRNLPGCVQQTDTFPGRGQFDFKSIRSTSRPRHQCGRLNLAHPPVLAESRRNPVFWLAGYALSSVDGIISRPGVASAADSRCRRLSGFTDRGTQLESRRHGPRFPHSNLAALHSCGRTSPRTER